MGKSLKNDLQIRYCPLFRPIQDLTVYLGRYYSNNTKNFIFTMRIFIMRPILRLVEVRKRLVRTKTGRDALFQIGARAEKMER